MAEGSARKPETASNNETSTKEENETNTDERDKWSPELLAAAVTILVTLLAAHQYTYPFLPSSSESSISAAITVVVAFALGRWIYRLSSARQFLITLAVTLLVVLSYGVVAYVHDTGPGRDARASAAHWQRLPIPIEPQGHRISAGETKYGTGYGVQIGGVTDIHIDSSKSNIIAWIPTGTTSSEYYAEAEARQSSGSVDTACILAFAYKSAKAFFQLALRSDGLQLAHWDGKIPARAYRGPISVPFATNLGDWHRIAVQVGDDRITAFVDDRLIFSDVVAGNLAGRVTFGTLDVGGGYTDDATCQFRNIEVLSK